MLHPPTIGPMPRSVKKWARSAHLHEVRPRGSERVPGADASGRVNGGEEKAVLKGAVWRKDKEHDLEVVGDENVRRHGSIRTSQMEILLPFSMLIQAIEHRALIQL